jgi:hypothetical protein
MQRLLRQTVEHTVQRVVDFNERAEGGNARLENRKTSASRSSEGLVEEAIHPTARGQGFSEHLHVGRRRAGRQRTEVELDIRLRDLQRSKEAGVAEVERGVQLLTAAARLRPSLRGSRTLAPREGT